MGPLLGPLFEGSEPVWPDRLRPAQEGPDLIGKDWGFEMGFERFWPEGLRRAQDPQKRGHFWGLSRSGALLAGMGRYWQIGANSSGKDWGYWGRSGQEGPGGLRRAQDRSGRSQSPLDRSWATVVSGRPNIAMTHVWAKCTHQGW